MQTKNAKNRPKLQKKSAVKSAAAEKSKKPAKRAASQKRRQGGCPKAAVGRLSQCGGRAAVPMQRQGGCPKAAARRLSQCSGKTSVPKRRQGGCPNAAAKRLSQCSGKTSVPKRRQNVCPKAAARRRPKALCRPQKQEIKLIGALKRDGKKSGRSEGRPLKRNFIYETAFSSGIVRHRSDSCAAYGKHFDPPRTESPSHVPHSRAAAQSAAVRAPPSDSWRR